MKKLRTPSLIALSLTLISTTIGGASAATEKSPINLCLHLYPSGPKTKPPVLAMPTAPKKCAKDFKYYSFPSLDVAIANLNAVVTGSFNAGLALGVYTAAEQLKSELKTKK